MPAEFKPLPDLDLSIPYATLHETSPRWTLPGSITSASVPTRLTRGFDGRSFFGQFTMAFDPMEYPLHEICGTRVYQNLDTVVFGDEPGDPPYFEEYLFRDYVFNTTPGSYAVTLTTTGDVTGYPAGDIGDSPDKGTYYRDMDDDGNFPKAGYVNKYSEVAFSYLDGKLQSWLSQSRDFRAATQGGLYWGAVGAGRSESDHGYYSYVSGAKISAKVDLTDDTVIDDKTTVFGYDPGFIGRVALVKRKNGPFVRDFSPLPPADMNSEEWGISVYKSGSEGIELFNPITEKHWRDSFGTYDRRQESAFSSLGYNEAGIDSGLVPTSPSSSSDRTAKIGFVGKDGVTTYRITLEVGHYPVSDFVSLETYVIDLPPSEMVEHVFSDYIENASEVLISKLESKIFPDDPFVEIVLSGGEFQQMPTPPCKVLVVTKVRSGERWGHYRLDSPALPPDYQDLTFYRTKRTFRDLKAETIT